MTEREINGDSTGTFLTLINDWEIPFFTVCRQKSSDGSFEDFVNSICNCISFTKVLVPALLIVFSVGYSQQLRLRGPLSRKQHHHPRGHLYGDRVSVT